MTMTFDVERDATAPAVTVYAPTRIQTSTIPVSWTVAELGSGATGVYTVSVMTDTGPLQPWLAGTSLTSGNFTGVLGHKYTFVVTATDRVSNTAQSIATTDAVQVTKYYYIGSTRVAMRQGDAVTYLHTDHLGTVSVATNQSQVVLARTLNLPYGGVRWTDGTMPTDWGFTGQKDDTYIKLIQMSARWYAPQIGRWISPDSVVPDLANPQSFNRYGYVHNNPLRYTDSSGHCIDGISTWICILLMAYLGGRVGYEVGSAILPGADSMRRDQIGGALAEKHGALIGSEARRRSIEPAIIASIVRHEGSAFERRLLTALPGDSPGAAANVAEAAQVLLRGEYESIGIAQMQLRRAEELERLGYVTPRSDSTERLNALLTEETAIEYIGGMVQYTRDQLQTIEGFASLSYGDQRRLILIGYNRGWELLRKDIHRLRFQGVIDEFKYDNETFDEYYRYLMEMIEQ